MEKNNVKKFREQKPWSMKRLATKAEVSEPVIKRMETEEPTTRVSKLKVAKALQKKFKEVFPNEED